MPDTLTVPNLPHLVIAAARWWNAPTAAGSLIGAVLVHDTAMGTVKAFIGSGLGHNEEADEVLIAEWGAKLAPDLGRVIFPAWASAEWAVDG